MAFLARFRGFLPGLLCAVGVGDFFLIFWDEGGFRGLVLIFFLGGWGFSTWLGWPARPLDVIFLGNFFFVSVLYCVVLWGCVVCFIGVGGSDFLKHIILC